ncbi:hypothetical protein D3C78_1200980 [compost metagenome]
MPYFVQTYGKNIGAGAAFPLGGKVGEGDPLQHFPQQRRGRQHFQMGRKAGVVVVVEINRAITRHAGNLNTVHHQRWDPGNACRRQEANAFIERDAHTAPLAEQQLPHVVPVRPGIMLRQLGRNA